MVGGDEAAAFRAHLAAFAFEEPKEGEGEGREKSASTVQVLSKKRARKSGARTPLAEKPTQPTALDGVHRDGIRLLPRCSVCASHFPTSYSAPKRRAHLVACAEKKSIPGDRLKELVDAHIAQELHAERTQWLAAQGRRTLMERMHLSTQPAPRWNRLANALPSGAWPVPLRTAAAGHEAARAASDVLLPRLQTPSHPPRAARRRTRHAPMYDAAYLSHARVLHALLATLDAPPGRRRSAVVPAVPDACVATSDDEEDACVACRGGKEDAYVATSDADEGDEVRLPRRA